MNVTSLQAEVRQPKRICAEIKQHRTNAEAAATYTPQTYRPMSLHSQLALLRSKAAFRKSTSLLKPSASRLWHRFCRLGSSIRTTTLITCQIHSITLFVLIRAQYIMAWANDTARGLRSNTPSPRKCGSRVSRHSCIYASGLLTMLSPHTTHTTHNTHIAHKTQPARPSSISPHPST